MKILIDGHMIGQGEGGNERYISSLIKSVGKSIKVDVLVSKRGLKIRGANKIILVSKSNLVRYLISIPKIVRNGKYDLVLTTYFVSPFIAKKNVIVVHDLLPMHHPEYFNLRERLQFLFLSYSIKNARGIFVPTEFVAQEMKRFFPNVASKIYVTPEAADHVFRPISLSKRKKLREKYNCNNCAVLVMASRLAKRPVHPVLEGLKLVKTPMTIFVMQGSGQMTDYIDDNLEIRYLVNLSDLELCEIYNLVDLVIYPTRYEGFGLPVLEAMQCGTVVLSNHIPAVVEVAGKSASYFDLDYPKTLALKVKKLLSNKKYQNDLIALGYNTARSYSWDYTAKESIAAWRKILGMI